MYGAQTGFIPFPLNILFENDVEMYGAQTSFADCNTDFVFENDVEMYGAQTLSLVLPKTPSV